MADFIRDFPDLAGDLNLPQLYNPCDYFSSVIRVSSPGLHLWTHYDTVMLPHPSRCHDNPLPAYPLHFAANGCDAREVSCANGCDAREVSCAVAPEASCFTWQMDNALVQVVGTKRVVLFPPSDADALYIKGDKSQVLDIDNPDLSLYPLFKNAHPFECTLHPGKDQTPLQCLTLSR